MISQGALLTKLTKLVDISSADDRIAAGVLKYFEELTLFFHKYPDTIPQDAIFPSLDLPNIPEENIAIENLYNKPQSDDKAKVRQILSDFDPNKSEAWKTITDLFGHNIKQPPLLEIARIVAEHVGIAVTRQARRRKSVLIKWYDDNWSYIKPYINYFDVNEETVTLKGTLPPYIKQ